MPLSLILILLLFPLSSITMYYEFDLKLLFASIILPYLFLKLYLQGEKNIFQKKSWGYLSFIFLLLLIFTVSFSTYLSPYKYAIAMPRLLFYWMIENLRVSYTLPMVHLILWYKEFSLKDTATSHNLHVLLL